jgi:hypothetical protein
VIPSINRLHIKEVATALRTLSQPFVFVGGATVELYGDPSSAPGARPTDDVDIVVELAGYGGYGELTERLIALGFNPDATSKVICRYRLRSIVVDVMPTHPDVLGFSNRWYPEGFRTAFEYNLDEETTVLLFTPTYFIASKLEAFAQRGGTDFRTSTDFEDIVYVLDNCPNLPARLQEGSGEVIPYLQDKFTHLLRHPDIHEGIYGHLEPRFAAQKTERILEILARYTRTR